MTKAKRGVQHKTNRSTLDMADLNHIPSEEISLEEAEELARLSEETKRDGLSWNKVKAELGL